MTPQPDAFEPRQPTEWSDERVEQALTWFFADELPPALRDGELPPALCRPAKCEQSYRVARPLGRWLVPLCLATLVGSGVVLQRATDVLSIAAPADSARIVRLDSTSLPLESEYVSFAGAQHQFTQRNELRWISESFFEPATGDLVEWSAPELIIDVDIVADRESELPP